MNGSVAAGVAYSFDRSYLEKIIALLDFGAEGFNISIFETGGGLIEVKAANGDNYIGGDNFDKIIIDWLGSEFMSAFNIDIKNDATSWQRLKNAAEKAKIELSSVTETEISIPYIATIEGVPRHIVKILTRVKFEQLCDYLFYRCAKLCEEMANYGYNIDEVVLVGGGNCMPRNVEMTKKIFGDKVSYRRYKPEAVALGAAIRGGSITGEVKDIIVLDVLPFSLGIEKPDGKMQIIISKNTTIPTIKADTITTEFNNKPRLKSMYYKVSIH